MPEPTTAALKARITELEELLEKVLPVVRLTPYVKLTARISDALQQKGWFNKDQI